MLGGGPKAFPVELSDEMAAQAGAKLFTCRILGVGRIIKLSEKVFARIHNLRSGEKTKTPTAPEPKTKKKKINLYLTTEEEWMVRYPPDLLLPAVVISADGDPLSREVIEEWVEDLPMAPAHCIGLAVLRASDLIEETEDESGKDSGGSSDS